MMKLAGYADRLSIRPGETLRFHVSNTTGAEIATRLVRVICADANPAGPGVQLEDVPAKARQIGPAAQTSPPLGSCAEVALSDKISGLSSYTIVATICPTRIGDAERSIASAVDPLVHRGTALGIDRSGRIMASFGTGQSFLRIEAPACLDEHAWYQVWLTSDAASGRVTVGSRPLASGAATGEPSITAGTLAGAPSIGATLLVIGGNNSGADHFRFNGRIERPMIFDRALSDPEIETAAGREPIAGLVASWDFAREMSSDRIVDVGPHGLHGRLIHSPTRAVTGSNWTGLEMNWRHAPEQYGAIHFHADDLDDCGWPVTHEWTVPSGIRSGNYALILDAGGEQDNIPFFVVPPKGKSTAKVAVLVSTFTYTVYANHLRPEWTLDPKWRSDWREQTKAWGAYPHHPGDNPQFGYSTYNFHTDGSGIALSSWHRPMLNIRIGYVTYPYPEIRGSGARHYQPDTHLTAWLEQQGIAYDIITDWELNAEGFDLLKDYTVLLTGTHPEYHTRDMLDALTRYRDEGGRFCYLGGNGFYWKIALSPTKPGVIEIRRGEGGIRAWAADPGEYYNQFDGEYGGLWRRNGRPPQMLAGVGFTAQGNFVGSYYRKTAEAADPRVSWMFEGIDGDIIGDFGLSGHGAAGFELDRTDKRLGTPAHAIVVAKSENHPPDAPWVLVPEEQLTHLVTLPGKPAKELIRADMTFFETAGGRGAVFSTGSITFCGSLPTTAFENTISRLLGNVVRRFLDPKPFASTTRQTNLPPRQN